LSLDRDKEFVWHPFTHQLGAKENIKIIKGEGIYLIAGNGERYMDMISSWWVNLHGHSHPYINQKISEQVNKLEHALFSGFTHEPAINLAERLLKILPGEQNKIFYSDNGSTSVEVALKMALQYWKNQGEERTIFFAFEEAYHGDTFGSMSVGARNVFNNAFEKLLFDVKHLPLPDENNIEEIKGVIKQIALSKKVAGFIFEPLVQGAAGMKMYDANLLDELLKICKENNILTIADEVMTGFGRTGKLFASENLKNSPDIICLSKGLTGGYLPLGVTACKKFIYNAFLSEDKQKTFFHGHSYTANPISCTAALASLDLLEKQETRSKMQEIAASHKNFAERVKGNKKLKGVRVCGTIIAFELNSTEGTHYLNSAAETISDYFLKEKIIIRPLGNIFYLIPPYCITMEELQKVHDAIDKFLSR
jgi:adenosylmethionine-8-amino-7-oxononanoate aminotransferase